MRDASDAHGISAAKELRWREMAVIDAAYAEGRIAREAWHEAVLELIESAYLGTDDPRAQSGYCGDAAQWETARRPLVRALPSSRDRVLSFLDIGCANGHLMETLAQWAAQDGIRVEPHGVDISAALVDLARKRCPQWAERIWVGNAYDWCPPQRFDVVRTGLEYVPERERPPFLAHLFECVVAPSGRLVVGMFNEEADRDVRQRQVLELGYVVTGSLAEPHRHPAVHRKAFWIDAR
ncbi:class I SAM-dependent methyltransferase [Nocardia sp. CDC160]|uniref:class I SAM-dependent methyltransferase n=1 Tax=Nocardia sp. CDC160 TaxID=3112166 RepID=UPI002DBABACE|nr:class I SAM-dependent methyltransferase [Nocardia sp. CDC160]MEC3917695.1 class I SAM-dependent methyltransferase [Nocardia sp. CDC160]